MRTLKTLDDLRALLGHPRESVAHKIKRALSPQMKAFIGRSPILMLSTVDAEGRTTVSPKGDGPGFVRVVDDWTLHLPERRGNKLVFSLQNILVNPNVGLLFLVPGTGETLRVQGTAELVQDDALCAGLSSRGNPALLVMVIRLRDAYFHCAKSLLRGEVWEPSTWNPAKVSFAEEIGAALGWNASQSGEFDAGVQERYKTEL